MTTYVKLLYDSNKHKLIRSAIWYIFWNIRKKANGQLKTKFPRIFYANATEWMILSHMKKQHINTVQWIFTQEN